MFLFRRLFCICTRKRSYDHHNHHHRRRWYARMARLSSICAIIVGWARFRNIIILNWNDIHTLGRSYDRSSLIVSIHEIKFLYRCFAFIIFHSLSLPSSFWLSTTRSGFVFIYVGTLFVWFWVSEKQNHMEFKSKWKHLSQNELS